MTTLTQKIGDAVTHRIPLRWKNAPFIPVEGEWFHIFTVKADADTDTDAQAKIQKTSDLGLTVIGSTAFVAILPVDTAGDADADPVVAALIPATYDFDIQSQNVANPTDVRTTVGKFILTRDVTRGTETAIPVYVANPGINFDSELLTFD